MRAASVFASSAAEHRSHVARISSTAPAYARRFMLVFVTGGSGFVGSHTTRRLVEEGHSARLLVRDEAKATRVLEGLDVDPAAVELVKGDVLDRTTIVSAIKDCDAAVHAAAAIG